MTSPWYVLQLSIVHTVIGVVLLLFRCNFPNVYTGVMRSQLLACVPLKLTSDADIRLLVPKRCEHSFLKSLMVPVPAEPIAIGLHLNEWVRYFTVPPFVMWRCHCSSFGWFGAVVSQYKWATESSRRAAVVESYSLVSISNIVISILVTGAEALNVVNMMRLAVALLLFSVVFAGKEICKFVECMWMRIFLRVNCLAKHHG